MTRAITRRATLRGTAAAAIGLAAGAAPALASAAPIHPHDARLIELADAAAALEQACNAFVADHRGHETDESDQAFGEMCSGFALIEEEIAGTPADTVVGLMAKARAAQVATMRAFDDLPFGVSLADDVWRLFGGGGRHDAAP